MLLIIIIIIIMIIITIIILKVIIIIQGHLVIQQPDVGIQNALRGGGQG